MDILITDYHCASNRGDAAILEGELSALDEVFPDANITVMTEYPTVAELMHGVTAVPQTLAPFRIGDLRKNFATAALLLDEWLLGDGFSVPGSDVIRDRLQLHPYYDADLVISTGGQFITDEYFPGKLGVIAELLLLDRLDTPVFLYGQSLGPFESTPYDGLIRRALNSVEMIVTRDEPSVDYLDALGVTDPPIHVRTDPAFSMPVDDATKPLQAHIGGELPVIEHEDGPVVSISTRRWPYFETAEGESNYFETIAALADHLIEERDARIVFASTCTGLGGYHTDDRLPAHEIIESMDHGETNAVDILTGEYTPQQLVQFFGGVDVHVGTRMHSNIFAIRAGTPVVPVEYQFKTTGLMEQLGLEEYVLDIERIEAKELIETTATVLGARESIAGDIEDHVPELRARSRSTADLIAEWVRTHS